MEPETALERPAGVVVLDAISLEDLEAPEVHRYSDLDGDFAGRCGECFSQRKFESELFGSPLEEPLHSLECGNHHFSLPGHAGREVSLAPARTRKKESFGRHGGVRETRSTSRPADRTGRAGAANGWPTTDAAGWSDHTSAPTRRRLRRSLWARLDPTDERGEVAVGYFGAVALPVVPGQEDRVRNFGKEVAEHQEEWER